jgi:hypothetical protein
VRPESAPAADNNQSRGWGIFPAHDNGSASGSGVGRGLGLWFQPDKIRNRIRILI